MSKLPKKAREPADNLLADGTKSEKKSRKRAADFFANDEAEPPAKADKPKEKASFKKSKIASSSKPSKEDGHPIETAKTIPGGDTVEVEPGEAPKSKKRKLKKGDGGDAGINVGTAAEKPAKKKSSTTRTQKKANDESGPAIEHEQSVNAEPVEKAKAIKVSKGKKSKVAAKAEDAEAQTEAAASDRPSKQEKAIKNMANSNSSAPFNENPELSKQSEDRPPEKVKVNKRPRARDNKAATAAEDGIGVTPKAMDERPFQTLLDKESHEEASQESGLARLGNKQAKKRKANADAPNLVDQLAQTGSAQKKLRRSEESSADESASKAMEDFATSSKEAITKFAAGASDYVGKLIGTNQKSIADDIAEVAEGVIAEKKAARKGKKAKKGKQEIADDDDSKANESVLRQSETAKENAKLPPDIGDEGGEGQGSEVDDEVDDQTAALLKGFESSDEDADSGDEGYTKGASIPKLPAKTTKELKKIKAGDEPGTVYIGRIPHGFYEQEMRTYFTQFGDVTKLRLSRNKSTGRSKHYAFIEFSSKDVASIAAQTMNNYLMFGHLLKCHLIPKEQVHPDIWKGANRKFKTVPWSKIQARKLEQPATKEVWGKRVEKEKARREKKLEKARSIGYEFDVGSLKGVEDVGAKAIEDAPAQEAIEAVPEEQEKSSKERKTKKDKAFEPVPERGLRRSDDSESEGVGSNKVLEQTIITETAKGTNGQLVVSEEVITKKPHKGGKKGKYVEAAVADAVAEASESSMPAARIAADEIVENISNAAHSIGRAIGLTSSTDEKAEKDIAIENGTAKRERKRKAKEEVEAKPAKKGKKEDEGEKKAKLVKGKKETTGKGKKEQARGNEVEGPAEEVPKEVVKEKKVKAVKEKREKGSKKDRKAVS